MSTIAVAKNASAEVRPGAEKLYIPPPGLAFRLVGYASQCAIFSRTDAEPEVGQYALSNGAFGDQWFTLLHGTGNRAGLFAIKGRKSGRVLFSRSETEPRVGHIEGDGAYGDNWFKLEQGHGQYAMYFRLITPSQNMALFSRTHAEPYFYNYATSNGVFSDQHFNFIWEDMQVDKVEYDFDAGRVISSSPIALAEQTLTNNSDREQEMSFSVNKGVTNSSSFEFSTGFTVTIGMEFSVGIPFISEGKFSVSVSSTNTWTWGQTTEFTTQYTATFPVKAGPHEKIRATSMVNQGILDVPYTMYLSPKRDPSVQVQTTGVWHGVSSWDLRHTITHLGSA